MNAGTQDDLLGGCCKPSARRRYKQAPVCGCGKVKFAVCLLSDLHALHVGWRHSIPPAGSLVVPGWEGDPP
jgi:hypothetical protein